MAEEFATEAGGQVPQDETLEERKSYFNSCDAIRNTIDTYKYDYDRVDETATELV